MASGPETKVLNEMRKAATEKYGDRIAIVKYHGGPYSQAGVSDLLICLDGLFIAVEVKAPEGKHPVTVKQKAFLDRIGRAGGYSAVCRTVEEFLAELADALDAMTLP